MNPENLEFREEEIVFSYFLTKTRISYDDIISLRKTNYFGVMLRSIAPFKPPLLSLPLGISWQCLIIETPTKGIALMISNCAEVFRELEKRIRPQERLQ